MGLFVVRNDAARTLGERRLPPVARVVLALEVLLGVGAVFGGGALVLAPDGHLLSMPTSMLAGSPFGDYLVPGLVLFAVIGVYPLVAAVMTFRRVATAPLAAMGVGVALMGWIALEMVMLVGWGSVAWTLYLLLGAAITAAGVWWRYQPQS